MLRLGTSAYCTNGNTDYRLMAEHGFSCEDYQCLAQTDSFPNTLAEDEFIKYLKDVRAKANAEGITFYQVHGPWPTYEKTEVERATQLEAHKKAVRGTAALGGEYMVLHPVMPYHDHDEDADFVEKLNVEMFSAICAYASDYNVRICIENMPFLNLRLASTKSIVEFVNKYNIPNLYICFDTGHANVFDEDICDMVRLCGDKLKALHIHDNMFHQDQHLLPYCGTIDWSGFNQALHDINFEGVINAECGIRSYMPEPMRNKARLVLVDILKDFAK